jgi:AcrR family transcriptional regulator
MPKQMFFNINKEKRQFFLDAAITEFTEKPFGEVSVNTIIKKANISRGSFYTYFDNLESLFNYLMKSVKEERFSYARKLIIDAKGDYFKFIRDLFLYDFDAFSTKGRYSLFRNYIHYIQQTKRGTLKDTLIADGIIQFTENKQDLNGVFHYQKMNLTKDEFVDIIEIVLLLMVNTFLKSENESLNKEETIALFNKRISYIEYGVTGGGEK